METGVVVQEQELKQEALTVVEQAKIVRIVDQPSYEHACSLLVDHIKPFRKRWQEYWDGIKKPAWAAYQAIQWKFNEADRPLETAERQVKTEIARWETEQARLREEAQRKAQEEAERLAREDAEKQALFAELAGAPAEEVEAIAAAPIVVVAPPVESGFEKVSGVSTREIWKCKVNDVKALCKGIAAGRIPVSYVVPNQQALDARAKADRKTFKVDGCVAYPEKVVAGRSR